MKKYQAFFFLIFSFQMLFSQSWDLDQIDVYNSFDDFEKVLKQNNDTTYVINFWATWCAPCVKELPYFEDLTSIYSDQKFKVVLVSLDFERQIKSRLLPFLNKNEIKSEVVLLLDSKESQWIDRVDPEWSGAIPITIVYNKSKREFFERSFSSTNELKEILNDYM